jgi:hypothetical protein
MSERPKEAIEIMRAMYNCPQDVQEMTYEDISNVYFALRYNAEMLRKQERDLSELRLKRLTDYDNHLDLYERHRKLARQYACECKELCSQDWQDQDYCGWRAKQVLEGE